MGDGSRVYEAELEFFPDDAEIDAFYQGGSAHAADIFGCRYFQGAAGGAGAWRFCLWAPNAKSVSVTGDFCRWDAAAHPMERYRGLWICFVDSAKAGDNYKFCVEGADGAVVMKADPYAAHAETSPHTASKVWDTGGYVWGDGDWLKRRAAANIFSSPVSIYEMHIGSWRTREGYEYPSLREITDEVKDYVLKMGFTHIELMPINEYPYAGSWGYQVTGFFAATSRFGTPQDFMHFVDTMHRAGIGVLVDWVPAHFPKDRHGLPHFDGTWLYEHQNPLRREHPQWGTYIFNYNRPEVVSFLVSSAVNLIELYHIDGIRVDAVSSVIYLDFGREKDYVRNKDGGNVDYAAVDFLKTLNMAVLGEHPGVVTVAEEATTYPLVTKPPSDGGLGFSFKWNMGFMHDTLDYMKIDPYFRHGAHDKLTFSMYYAFSENFILPYSHDEVVHGKFSMIGKMFGDYDTKFASLKTLYGWLFGHPGKKLLFMGSEFAQFIEWDFQKELDWFLLEYNSHAGMQAWVRALNRLYRKSSALYARDGDWDGFQWLTVDDRRNSVFAFMRSDGDSHMVCVYNFSGSDFAAYDVALPCPGRLLLALSSVDPLYGFAPAPEVFDTGGADETGLADDAGKTDFAAETGIAQTPARISPKKTAAARSKPLHGMPCSATLALPKTCAVFYVYRVKK